MAKLDQRACLEVHQFFEFRNLAACCPHDYVFFEKELTPLIANIHGESSTLATPRDEGGTTSIGADRCGGKWKTLRQRALRAVQDRDQIRELEKKKRRGLPRTASRTPDAEGQDGDMPTPRFHDLANRTRMAARHRSAERDRHLQPHPPGPQPGRFSLHPPLQ
jgi:protein arginine kinase activator